MAHSSGRSRMEIRAAACHLSAASPTCSAGRSSCTCGPWGLRRRSDALVIVSFLTYEADPPCTRSGFRLVDVSATAVASTRHSRYAAGPHGEDGEMVE